MTGRSSPRAKAVGRSVPRRIRLFDHYVGGIHFCRRHADDGRGPAHGRHMELLSASWRTAPWARPSWAKEWQPVPLSGLPANGRQLHLGKAKHHLAGPRQSVPGRARPSCLTRSARTSHITKLIGQPNRLWPASWGAWRPSRARASPGTRPLPRIGVGPGLGTFTMDSTRPGDARRPGPLSGRHARHHQGALSRAALPGDRNGGQ